MKLNTPTTAIKGCNIEQSVAYRVANTAHMMKLLSDSLYSDKVAAVIRELSTNAWDAHIDAGHRKPFDVTIPKNPGDIFKIRDYGTGMSLEKLLDMYRTYGFSDKNNSNDFTGCLGLGSKSPFCYTNDFITISYYNGKKYTIINSKDKNGLATFNLMRTEDTDEPNGLEVSMVCNSLVNDFHNKAQGIYQYFDVKPNIFGRSVDIKVPSYLLEGTGWGYTGGNSKAIMGQVAYSINSSQFDTEIRTILNCGFDLYFDLGDIAFVPGREQLEYTEKTKLAIIDKLAEVKKDITEHFENEVATCNSLWAARQLMAKSKSQFFNVLAWIKADIKFQNYEVDWTARYVPNREKFVTYFCYHKHDNNVTHHRTGIHLDANNDYLFVLWTGETCIYDRCRKLAKDKKSKILLVKYHTPSLGRQYLTDFIGVLDSDIIEGKTLDRPTIVRNSTQTTKPSNTTKVFKFRQHPYSGYTSRSFWGKSEYLDLDNETGYYIPIRNGMYVDGTTRDKEIDSVYYFAKEYGINVVGIPNNNVNAVKKHKNWKDIRELVKEKVDSLSNNQEYGKYITWYNYSISTHRIATLINNIGGSPLLLDAVQELNSIQKDNKWTRIEQAAEIFGINIKPMNATPKILDLLKRNPIIKVLALVDFYRVEQEEREIILELMSTIK